MQQLSVLYQNSKIDENFNLPNKRRNEIIKILTIHTGPRNEALEAQHSCPSFPLLFDVGASRFDEAQSTCG